jgi:hypothetical protein
MKDTLHSTKIKIGNNSQKITKHICSVAKLSINRWCFNRNGKAYISKAWQLEISNSQVCRVKVCNLDIYTVKHQCVKKLPSLYFNECDVF